MARKKSSTDDHIEDLRAFGLRYPGAHLKSPWPGHLDLAVNDKTFAYLSIAGAPFSISCKLPRSCEAALMMPFTKPTAYGLGKSGWVSAEFAPGEMLPVGLFRDWIDESYRAQAPKRLVAELDAAEAAAPAGQARPIKAVGTRAGTTKAGATNAGATKARGTKAGSSKSSRAARASRSKPKKAAGRIRTR